MSTYAACETALLILIRAYNNSATFAANNSSQHDWAVLDAAGTAQACVVHMHEDSAQGERLNGRGSGGKRQQQHHIAVDVYQARQQGQGGDGVAYVALTTLTDALVAWLDRWPHLGNTSGVLRAEVTHVTTPAYVSPRATPDASTHLVQTIIVQIATETANAFSESGPS